MHYIGTAFRAQRISPVRRACTYSAVGLGLTVRYSAVGLGLTVRYSAVGLGLTVHRMGALFRSEFM